MTHWATLVIVPPETADVEAKVSELLAPYDENGEWFKDGSRWDWWVIGGRYSGQLAGRADPRYNPAAIEANYERCTYCGGTGTRDSGRHYAGADGEWARRADDFGHPVIGLGCNVCRGTGWEFKFSSKWEMPPDADVRPMKDVAEDFRPYAVVTPDGKWHERGRFGFWAAPIKDENGNEHKPENEWEVEWTKLASQYAPDHIAVLVDCHV